MNSVLFPKIDQVFSFKKNLKKHWKSPGILLVRKIGNYVSVYGHFIKT